MLTVLTIAKIANSTTQSNPMLIPSDGSPDMATFLVMENVPTLVQPPRDECGAVHMKAKMLAADCHERDPASGHDMGPGIDCPTSPEL